MNWSQVLFVSLFISSAWGAEVPAQPSAVASSTPNTVAEMLGKLRDPFKRPALKGIVLLNRGDLESFSVESLKVVGILTGPTRIRALVVTPDGKSHLVTEKSKIGIRGGIVKKITPDGILVREKVVNVIGQEENIDTEIQLITAGSRVLQEGQPKDPVQSINPVGIDSGKGVSDPRNAGGSVLNSMSKGMAPLLGK